MPKWYEFVKRLGASVLNQLQTPSFLSIFWVIQKYDYDQSLQPHLGLLCLCMVEHTCNYGTPLGCIGNCFASSRFV